MEMQREKINPCENATAIIICSRKENAEERRNLTMVEEGVRESSDE